MLQRRQRQSVLGSGDQLERIGLFNADESDFEGRCTERLPLLEAGLNRARRKEDEHAIAMAAKNARMAWAMLRHREAFVMP